MSKRVLVISTSLRKDSNSEGMADEFVRGAKDAGNEVQKISLRGKSIAFCQGCLACQKTGRCVISDDAVEVAQKMQDAEVVVFATPIYYYEMSGQMKTMLDRANPLYGSDYQFREVYLLTCAAEEDEGAAKRAVEGLKGWIACFEKAKLAGALFAGGVTEAGEIKEHSALQKAYEMGRAIR